MVGLRLLLIVLLCSQSLYAGFYSRAYPRPIVPSNYDTVQSVGKAAFALGCVAAVGYGVYKLCDWLFAPSDEKVLQKGIETIQYVHVQYDTLIQFMEFHYSHIPDSAREQKILIQNVNESLLYEFAVSYKKETSIASILTNLENTISSLKSSHSALAGRIKKLRAGNENPTMLLNMQQIDQEIVGLVCKLEFVHEYFVHHKSYYSLFELETQLMRSYEFELSSINQNYAYLKEVVRASAMRHSSAYNGYPYMNYVSRLQSNIGSLTNILGFLAYNYMNRIGAANVLLMNLQTLHNVAVAEDAYHQELLAYKKEQLEKERIEVEKAKAAAAAAQASAMQQQAWHMQHQNQLQAERIRVDTERNAILATQTMVNALNPQPHVNVYV